MELSGRTVLLTGASGGIGAAIARALDARGASLILSARREEVLTKLADELSGDVRILPADLAEPGSPLALAERAGHVDALVANAALPGSGRLESFEHDEIDRAIAVNLRAPMQLTRALLPAWLERGEGHLVLMSSLAGKVVTAGSAVYSATKAGLRAFATGLREDLHGTQVGVTAVFPGFIREAGMFAEAGVDLPRYVGTSSPEDVAAAVVEGIERGRSEIDVAPLPLRAGALFSALAPGLGGRLQRRLGSGRIAGQMAEGQAEKR